MRKDHSTRVVRGNHHCGDRGMSDHEPACFCERRRVRRRNLCLDAEPNRQPDQWQFLRRFVRYILITPSFGSSWSTSVSEDCWSVAIQPIVTVSPSFEKMPTMIRAQIDQRTKLSKPKPLNRAISCHSDKTFLQTVMPVVSLRSAEPTTPEAAHAGT